MGLSKGNGTKPLGVCKEAERLGGGKVRGWADVGL